MFPVVFLYVLKQSQLQFLYQLVQYMTQMENNSRPDDYDNSGNLAELNYYFPYEPLDPIVKPNVKVELINQDYDTCNVTDVADEVYENADTTSIPPVVEHHQRIKTEYGNEYENVGFIYPFFPGLNIET